MLPFIIWINQKKKKTILPSIVKRLTMDLGMSNQMLSPDNFQNQRNSKPQKELSLILKLLHGMLTWEIEGLLKRK